MTCTGLVPLWHYLCYVWLRWAQREINPLHEDVPHIVRRINELETTYPTFKF